MAIVEDFSKTPACSHDGCGLDAFGNYHGLNCARSRHFQDQLRAWMNSDRGN